jgi:hypothetical protein
MRVSVKISSQKRIRGDLNFSKKAIARGSALARENYTFQHKRLDDEKECGEGLTVIRTIGKKCILKLS